MKRLSFANVTSVLALFVALGGTSYAALTITGSNVRDGSLTSADIRDRSLRAKDFRKGELRRGPQGPVGARGPTGDRGIPGPKGDPGGASGRAGGALSGTYPDPGLADGAVGSASIADRAVTPSKHGVVPAVKVGQPSTQNGVLFWSSELFDTALMHQAGTTGNRLVATVPGVYVVTLNVAFSGSCNTSCSVRIHRGNADAPANASGTAVAWQNGASGTTGAFQTGALSVATTLSLTQGQWVGGVVEPTGQGVSSATEMSSLAMTWMGPLE